MAKKKEQAPVVEELELQAEEEALQMLDELEQDGEEESEALYDADGNELLFPEGPTLNQIEEWKSRYGEVYLTEFEEDVFIWRALSRKEYKDIMKVEKADNFYKEERICDTVVLFPSGYNFMAMSRGKAGIPSLISELVLEKSGFSAKTGALRL